MGKKIVSYVLACLISVVFSVSVFAAGTATGSASGPTSVAQQVDSAAEQTAGNALAARISQVFNYQSGILTSATGADGTISIFDAGKARASYALNDDGNYGMTSFNVYGTDGITTEAALRSYATKFGAVTSDFQDSGSFQVSGQTVSAGTWQDGDNANPKSVTWFDETTSFLKGGINQSVSINFGASYGASVTMMTNGKAQYSLAYDGTKSAEWVYDAQGFVSEQKTRVMASEGFNTGSGNGAWKDGWQTTKFVEGKAVSVVDNKGNKTVSFTYDNLGNIKTQTDLTTNNTTHFNASGTAYVTNEKGTKISTYNYNLNGTLNNIVSNNNGEVSTSVFLNNRALGSYKGTSANPDSARAALLQAYRADTVAEANAARAQLDKLSIQGLEFSNSQLKNMSADVLTALMGWGSAGKDEAQNLITQALKYGGNTGTTLAMGFAEREDGKGNFASSGTLLGKGGAQLVSYNFADLDPTPPPPPPPPPAPARSSDPVVSGNVEAVITGEEAAALGLDANKTYVQVAADFIDVMDANGGEAVDGEMIFVEVTADVAANVKAGDSAMFMGDVSTETTSGRFVLTMNVNYGGGVVVGEEEVNARKETYMNEGWALENRAANTSFFSQTFGSAVIDWQTGWNALVDALRSGNDGAGDVAAMF